MQDHVDRFYAAVAVLAGDGHIKQRLISAYQDNIASISEDDFPTSLKNDLLELKTELSRVEPLKGESTVCASVRKMSVGEASHCAALVLSLYAELRNLRDSVQDTLPLGVGLDTEGGQPFLVKSVG